MQFLDKNYFDFDQIPIGIGAVLKGWDITKNDFRNPNTLPIVDFRAMTESCHHNCFHCFTEKRQKTLTLKQIKRIIDELSDLKTYGINYVGEGEPSLDKDFFEIIEYTATKGIHPIIFTDAATKMTNRAFVKRVFQSGASICSKCDSLFNAKYQNMVVGDKNNTYFKLRNRALEIMINEGFNQTNDDGSTRLGFNMVISSKNINEVPETLRFCRKNNLWVIFTFYLPTGKSGNKDFDQFFIPTNQEKTRMREQVNLIDKNEYSFEHTIWNNFSTTPCVEFLQIYGNGEVSPCPGNETIIGRIQNDSIINLKQKILNQFPKHNQVYSNGHCLYR